VRKRILGLLAVLAVAAGLSLVVATPASASFSDCSAGIGCVWMDANGGGTKWSLPISLYGTTCHNMTEGGVVWDNAISSAQATYGSGYGLKFYLSTNCGGVNELDVPSPNNINFGGSFPPWNDTISSFRIAII